MFLDIILLVIIFVVASIGSTKLLELYGYPLPVNYRRREDWIIFGMKLVLFALLVVVQFIILLLIGYSPGE